MPRQVRDRLALTYGLWTVIFAAVVAGMAWKYGWLQIEWEKPGTGTLAEHSEPPAPPEAGAPSSRPPADAVPEWPAKDQLEPPVEEVADREAISGPPSAGAARDAATASRDPARKSLPFSADIFPPRAGRGTSSRRGAANTSVPNAGLPSVSAAPPGADPNVSPSRRNMAPPPVEQESAEFVGRPSDTLIATERPPRSVEPEPYPTRRPIDLERSDPPRRGTARRGIIQVGAEAAEPGEQGEPIDTEAAASPKRRPAAGQASDPRLSGVEELLASGDRLAAHKEMSKLYWKEASLRPLLQDRIDANAKVIYFAPQPHYMEPYVVQPGDQLQKVAKQYQVPWEYLVRLNQIDPKRIRPAQRLKVIKGPFAAMVDLSDFELIVHAHGYYVKRYQVGIGKDDSTPIGKFTVKTKLKNPTYYGPNGLVIDADDPSNPLGERWLDIGDSYGIHGTIDPASIGKASSRGCIRLTAEDIDELYDLLSEGSEVIIRK